MAISFNLHWRASGAGSRDRSATTRKCPTSTLPTLGDDNVFNLDTFEFQRFVVIRDPRHDGL